MTRRNEILSHKCPGCGGDLLCRINESEFSELLTRMDPVRFPTMRHVLKCASPLASQCRTSIVVDGGPDDDADTLIRKWMIEAKLREL